MKSPIPPPDNDDDDDDDDAARVDSWRHRERLPQDDGDFFPGTYYVVRRLGGRRGDYSIVRIVPPREKEKNLPPQTGAAKVWGSLPPLRKRLPFPLRTWQRRRRGANNNSAGKSGRGGGGKKVVVEPHPPISRPEWHNATAGGGGARQTNHMLPGWKCQWRHVRGGGEVGCSKSVEGGKLRTAYQREGILLGTSSRGSDADPNTPTSISHPSRKKCENTFPHKDFIFPPPFCQTDQV